MLSKRKRIICVLIVQVLCCPIISVEARVLNDEHQTKYGDWYQYQLATTWYLKDDDVAEAYTQSGVRGVKTEIWYNKKWGGAYKIGSSKKNDNGGRAKCICRKSGVWNYESDHYIYIDGKYEFKDSFIDW